MSISVVVPSLNQGQYIETCLTSILEQQFDDLELIVVDGGSTDETVSILNRYASRISHLIIEPDSGQADALNKGFALATGDIQCYLNSDDYLLPGTLEFVEAYFSNHPFVDALYSDRIFVSAEGDVIGCWRLPAHIRYLMERWDYIPQETCFWRRGLYEKTSRIDKNLQFAMDYDLFIQFMRLGKMKHLPVFLSGFRDHDQSKTHNLNASVGKMEVQQIKDKYGIRSRQFDRILGSLLRRTVEFRSKRFFETRLNLLQEAHTRHQIR